MDAAVTAWLRAQLGPTTDEDDLAARYERLGAARAVALEVLAERRATLLAEPLRMTVDGVMSYDHSSNLAGVERLIADVQDAAAPDEETPGDHGTVVVAPVTAGGSWTR
jgi:hypothetical protein